MPDCWKKSGSLAEETKAELLSLKSNQLHWWHQCNDIDESMFAHLVFFFFPVHRKNIANSQEFAFSTLQERHKKMKKWRENANSGHCAVLSTQLSLLQSIYRLPNANVTLLVKQSTTSQQVGVKYPWWSGLPSFVLLSLSTMPVTASQ